MSFTVDTAALRRIAMLALVGVALLASGGVADALTIKSFRATIDPAKSDKFQVAGAYEGLVIDGAELVVLHAGHVDVALPIATFTRKRDRLSYRAPHGSNGVTAASLDLKKRTFAIKGVGLSLAQLTGPVAVHFGTESASECSIAIVKEGVGRPSRAHPRPKHTLALVKSQETPASCALADTMFADPPTVVVDTPSAVRVTIVPATAPDAGSLRLFHRDPKHGGAIEPALCTFADDGGDGDDLAGDGVFGCTTTLTEATRGTLALVATATANGMPIVSSVLRMYVGAPPTDGDVDALFATTTQAGALWSQNATALGDTVDARIATVRALQALPGVDDAAIAANGLDVGFVMASGLAGSLMLSPRVADAAPTARAGGAASSLVAPAAALSRAATRVANAAAADTCPPPKERHLVGSTKALVWDAGYFPGPTQSEGPFIGARLASMCPFQPGDVTQTGGPQCDVASLANLTQYDTMAFVSHGVLDWFDRPSLVTTQVVNAQTAPAFKADVQLGRLLPTINPIANTLTLAATPTFVADLPGRFHDALVYGGFCWSDLRGSLAAAFLAKGAATFFGYDSTVSTGFAARSGVALFDGLVTKQQTTGESFAAVTPKVDPYRRPLGVRGVTAARKPPARFRIEGDHDLAYLGTPTLDPAAAAVAAGETQPFTADVLRGETCQFAYDWKTTGAAGDLADGMGHQGIAFASSEKTVTYRAAQQPSAEADTVSATIRIVDPTAPGDTPPVFAEVCADVVIARCGDGIRSGVEECDGTDDAACVGFCQVDCTCPPTTMEIVFVGKGKWRQTVNGVSFSASESWVVHYTYELIPQASGFPKPPGAGTTVDGTSTITGSPTSNCNGPIVVNRSHGVPTAETPLLWTAPSGSSQNVRLVLDTFGGYDYRLCDGEYNTLVGQFAPPPNGFPNYAPGIGFADLTFALHDWVGAAPHAQTFTGLGASDVAAPGLGSADACWTGTIQLSTEGGGVTVPSLAGVPDPSCF